MSKMTFLKKAIVAAVLSTAAMAVYAEDAPVFDADNYPPQFDGQADSGPQPPAPSASTAPASSGSTALAPQGQSDQQPTITPQIVKSAPDQSYTPPNLPLDQRVARVEQQINNMQHDDSTGKMDALHNEVQSLRGQIDDLNHQLQQLQSQQKSMYADLNKRLNKQAAAPSTDVAENDTAPAKSAKKKPMVAKAAATDSADTTSTDTDAGSPPATKSSAQPNVAEEQQVYQTAYDLIKAKKYDQAISTLKSMLNKYPSGQFAANAHYWLGELYGLQGKNDQSSAEFGSVVNHFPNSPKVSDAQLKLGLIFAAEFKWNDARIAFKKVINHYPGTASARLASEQLKQIKLAGH